jgi:DNA-binding LacI/PurR family transcriptional regulator
MRCCIRGTVTREKSRVRISHYARICGTPFAGCTARTRTLPQDSAVIDFPHVLVDEALPDDKSPSVGTTNRKSSYSATRHLLDLNHRRIGYITDTMELNTAVERLKG